MGSSPYKIENRPCLGVVSQKKKKKPCLGVKEIKVMTNVVSVSPE